MTDQFSRCLEVALIPTEKKATFGFSRQQLAQTIFCGTELNAAESWNAEIVVPYRSNVEKIQDQLSEKNCQFISMYWDSAKRRLWRVQMKGSVGRPLPFF